MYTIDYFIEKFENIPNDKWCVGTFSEKSNKFLGLIKAEKYCAQGHCGIKSKIQADLFVWGKPINELIEASVLYHMFGGSNNTKSVYVATINNGNHVQYQQDTPKLRILAALNDMKKGIYPHMVGEYWDKYNKEKYKLELEKAKKEENYEEAAKLRDLINNKYEKN